MIAAWMIASTLFALLLGIAAVAGERALRIVGRQARGVWLFAMTGAVLWPAIAPAVSSLLAAFSRGATLVSVLPPGSSVATIVASAPALSRSWVSNLDLPLVGLWLAASLLLLARLAWSMRALSRLERNADREMIDGVSVLVTESIGPAVFGTRRSRVLVPRWLLDLDAPLRELVLRHEQEHCRARDPHVTLAVAVAIALMPWNAGVWWIARRLRLAVELDCDARVLRGARDTERYSKLLLFIAQRQSVVRLAPMLAESNSHLGRRIAAMNATRPNNPRARLALFAIVAVGALAYSTKFASELTAAPSVSLRDFTHDESLRAAVKEQALQRPAAAVTVTDSAATMKKVARRTSVSSAPAAPPVVAAPDTDPAAKAPHAPSLDGITGPGNRVAMAIPGTPTPRYPDILKQAGVEGGVLVAFVVDTSGNVDPQTIKFFVSTHQLFTESVKAALPNMHFLPATLNYIKVKQVVRFPIAFAIVGSPLSTNEGYRAVIEKLLADEPSSKFMSLGALVITAVSP